MTFDSEAGKTLKHPSQASPGGKTRRRLLPPTKKLGVSSLTSHIQYMPLGYAQLTRSICKQRKMRPCARPITGCHSITHEHHLHQETNLVLSLRSPSGCTKTIHTRTEHFKELITISRQRPRSSNLVSIWCSECWSALRSFLTFPALSFLLYCLCKAEDCSFSLAGYVESNLTKTALELILPIPTFC